MTGGGVTGGGVTDAVTRSPGCVSVGAGEVGACAGGEAGTGTGVAGAGIGVGVTGFGRGFGVTTGFDGFDLRFAGFAPAFDDGALTASRLRRHLRAGGNLPNDELAVADGDRPPTSRRDAWRMSAERPRPGLDDDRRDGHRVQRGDRGRGELDDRR